MKTIIYIGGFDLPDKNAAAHRVINNGKILRKLGYNVIFVGVDKSLKNKSNILSSKKAINGFDTYAVSYPKTIIQWINFYFSIANYKKIISMYSDIDFVILYNFQSIPFIRLITRSRSQKFNIISDCTEWYGIQGKNFVLKMIKGMDSFIRMRIIQKRVFGLIVISEYLLNYYQNHKNIIAIPPLVDINDSKWIGSKKKKPNNDTLQLVYSGSPGFKKDKINLIIRSLYELRGKIEFKFKVIGISRIDYLNMYPKDNLIISKLNDNIVFLGRISHSRSIEHLRMADYSIFFRQNNIINKAGFPTKLVESFTCGVPVITNYNSNYDNFIDSTNNCFFTKNISKLELKNILIKAKEYNSNSNAFNKQRVFNYKNYIDEFVLLLNQK